MTKVNSTLGRLSGHTGNLVYSTSLNQTIQRTMPSHYIDRNSDSQKAVRLIFSTVNDFYNKLRWLIYKGWYPLKPGMSQRNSMMQYLITHCIEVIADVPTIIYSKVRLYQGQLYNQTPYQTSTPGIPNTIRIQWNTQIHPKSNITDFLLIQAYCPDLNQGYTDNSGQSRSVGTYDLGLNPEWSGHVVHLWCNWMDALQKYSSTTVYLGFLTL